MTESNEYKGHCIIIRDDNGNVIKNPTIEWHYPSGVGAWGRDEIIAEPMNPEDIIWLATQRKELLAALEDLLELYTDAVDTENCLYPGDDIAEARAAIAKARGEQ